MDNSLIVVFTQRNDETRRFYLDDIGLSNFSQEGCAAASVVYPSGGHCVDQHASRDADILLVSDVEVDDDTRAVLRHYIDQSEKVIVVYHQGARGAIDSHKTAIQDLCESEEVCSKEEHSTEGNTFDCLTEIAAAVSENDQRQYEKAVKQIIRFVCGDPILEAKLDLLHKLLVPPAEDSGDWQQIEQDWSNLMKLVEANSEEKGNKGQYSQAWEDFVGEDPQQYSDDPFNEKYCGSEDKEGMLEKLRDGLFATAS